MTGLKTVLKTKWGLLVVLSVAALAVSVGACGDDEDPTTDGQDAGQQRDVSTRLDLADTATTVDTGSEADTQPQADSTVEDSSADMTLDLADSNADTGPVDSGSGQDLEQDMAVQDTAEQDLAEQDVATDTAFYCTEDTVGTTSGLVSLGSNGLLEIGQQYDDLSLCDPFLIDFFKFTPATNGSHVVTVSHAALTETECFLVGLQTDPDDTETLFDADEVDQQSTESAFTYSVSMDTRYYMTVLKLSPCSAEGDLLEGDYGIIVSSP